MGRVYTASFPAASGDATTLTSATAYDLFNIASGTSGSPLLMAFSIHMITLAQRTATAWEAHPVELWRYSGAYTTSSGGNSITPRPQNFGDSAATATARNLDTTAASGGTSVKLWGDEWVYLNNFLYLPAPEDRHIFAPGQACVLRFPSVTGTSLAAATGQIVFEELN